MADGGAETVVERPSPPVDGVAGRAGSVELARVTKRFGSMVAVDDLSLNVEPGEFLSLLGPSGCGKTTTLRMVAGFEHPEAGTIRISGADVAGVPPYRRDVNTVFQHYALFPHMTVAENVAYGLRQQRVPKPEISRRVGEVLEMVAMGKLAKRRPRQLSGGQQQRVALARALVKRPAVLLLDEPLGALDRKLRQEMQIELKLLQTQVGTTFLYVTHDQEEALSMSDRIAVMLDGRIEQLDEPEHIYDRPASAFVAGFIGLNNFLPGTQGSMPGEVDGAGFTGRAAHSGADVVRGGAVLLTVRPEHVEVRTDPPDGEVNRLEGVLAGVSHLGEVIQYVVHAGDLEVLSRRPRDVAVRLPVGERVWCTWSPAQAHVFADRGTEALGEQAPGEAVEEAAGVKG
jgi:spermidine/putrescine transport system ATP-binding protein